MVYFYSELLVKLVTCLITANLAIESRHSVSITPGVVQTANSLLKMAARYGETSLRWNTSSVTCTAGTGQLGVGVPVHVFYGGYWPKSFSS